MQTMFPCIGHQSYESEDENRIQDARQTLKLFTNEL